MKKYEIFEFDGIGYKKLFHHQDWRIAILNYIDELEIDKISYIEAHENTDEVFVLLNGSCTLFFPSVENNLITSFEALKLEPFKVYKVNSGIFHTHLLSKDAKLLIIEEEDTSEDNSPKIYLDDASRELLKNSISELSDEI